MVDLLTGVAFVLFIPLCATLIASITLRVTGGKPLRIPRLADGLLALANLVLALLAFVSVLSDPSAFGPNHVLSLAVIGGVLFLALHTVAEPRWLPRVRQSSAL